MRPENLESEKRDNGVTYKEYFPHHFHFHMHISKKHLCNIFWKIFSKNIAHWFHLSFETRKGDFK